MNPSNLEPEAELAIRRYLDAELGRYATEAQSYRTHLEVVMRNMLYVMGILGAIAVILFTYFFGKTSSDISAHANAMIDERVLDYKVKEDVRHRLEEMVGEEVKAPQVRASIDKQLATLAQAAVTQNAQKAITEAVDAKIAKLPNISQEQIRADIAQSLPVGTVVSSLLSPNTFYQQANRDAATPTWLLADGRNASGTLYANLLGKPTLPDLRGMFLRGLNADRKDGQQDPDGANREAGDYQADLFGAHSHRYGDSSQAGSGSANAFDARPKNLGYETEKTGGTETRPRNVAVYYYIKVN